MSAKSLEAVFLADRASTLRAARKTRIETEAQDNADETIAGETGRRAGAREPGPPIEHGGGHRRAQRRSGCGRQASEGWSSAGRGLHDGIAHRQRCRGYGLQLPRRALRDGRGADWREASPRSARPPPLRERRGGDARARPACIMRDLIGSAPATGGELARARRGHREVGAFPPAEPRPEPPRYRRCSRRPARCSLHSCATCSISPQNARTSGTLPVCVVQPVCRCPGHDRRCPGASAGYVRLCVVVRRENPCTMWWTCRTPEATERLGETGGRRRSRRGEASPGWNLSASSGSRRRRSACGRG